MSDDVFEVSNEPVFDESIVRWQYQTIQPFTQNFAENDEIRIHINPTDVSTYPHNSLIDIKGKMTKPDGTLPDFAKDVEMSPNFAAFLFSEIQYVVGGTKIDYVKNPGMASYIKGLASYSTDEARALTLASWIQPAPSTDGYFHFQIPLSHVFGFAEDYNKVIINASQELILHRARTSKNSYKATEELKITLTSIQWLMPFLRPNDKNQGTLMKLINENQTLPIVFRSWELFEYPGLPATTHVNWPLKTSANVNRPRYVLVAFQTDRKDQIGHHITTLDTCNVTNVTLYLNSEKYPYVNHNCQWRTNEYASLYSAFVQFRNRYYKYEEKDKTSLTAKDFKSFPIWIIDASCQPETINAAGVSATLEFEASANFAANTTAYALVLSDKYIEMSAFTRLIKDIL